MSGENKKTDPFALEAGVPRIEGDIAPTPKFADRISKRVFGILFVVLILVVGIFFAALEAMEQKKRKDPETIETRKEKSLLRTETEPPKELTEVPDAGGSKGGAGQSSLVGTKPIDQDDLLVGGSSVASLSNGVPQGYMVQEGQSGLVPGIKGAPLNDDGLSSAAAAIWPLHRRQ